MPGMNGHEMLERLRADPALKHIPVMLVTTLSDSDDVIRGLECGADNFIRKPYEEKYLLSRINYLLMNVELRKNQRMQMALEINLSGHKHAITAERQQILDLLISTYEQAVQVNSELKQREKELENIMITAKKWNSLLFVLSSLLVIFVLLLFALQSLLLKIGGISQF